jgi:hypothetical protein
MLYMCHAAKKSKIHNTNGYEYEDNCKRKENVNLKPFDTE